MSERNRIDLSAIDAMLDAGRRERLVSRINAAARSELARRSRQAGVLSLISRWAWPTVAAASLAAVVSGAALVLTRNRVLAADSTDGVVQFLGITDPVAVWLDAERPPTEADVIALIEGGER
ncbi:MAG: hypothetical protein ACREM1_11950 [Longimicrobiales bacterium]